MTLREIAEAAGCELRGDGSIEIAGVSSIEDSVPGTLTFLADRRYAPLLAATRAAAVMLPSDGPDIPLPSLRARHPYVAMVRVLELFHPATRPAPGMHPTAVVAPSARLGEGCTIGPHVVVGEGVQVGRDAVLHANVTVYPGVQVGDGFTAHAGVVLYPGVTIGDRVTIHAGTVIGSDGFGYVPLPDGHRKIPQVGTVVIEDDVEVGANTTIDRGGIGATVIGRGTKIDNLVQIAHGVRIGEGCLLAAQVGLAGGTVVGRGVMLGGQVGSAGHLTIGDGARVGAKGGVAQDIPPGETQSGYPSVEVRLWRRVTAALGRLPELLRRVRRIERQLGLRADED